MCVCGEICFKELAYMIIGASKSRICRADSRLETQAGFDACSLECEVRRVGFLCDSLMAEFLF